MKSAILTGCAGAVLEGLGELLHRVVASDEERWAFAPAVGLEGVSRHRFVLLCSLCKWCQWPSATASTVVGGSAAGAAHAKESESPDVAPGGHTHPYCSASDTPPRLARAGPTPPAQAKARKEWGDEGGRQGDSVSVQVTALARLAADARDAG